MFLNIWLLWLVIDWVVILSAFFILPMIGWFGWILTAFIIATRQHAIGILGHDGAHNLAIPKNIPLNDLLTKVFCLWPIGIDLSNYRQFHFSHHRNIGSPNDPEMIIKKWAHGNEMPDKLMKIKLIICDLIGLGIPELVKGVVIINGTKLTILIAPIVCHIIMMLLFGWQFTVLWFISLITIQWAIFRYRVWLEHQGLDGETWSSKKRLLDFLLRPHNTGYHKEHHEKPGIPFYMLSKLGD